ncbi:MAG: 30S ribosomal protein S6 [Desulfovibrionales bacterium]
MKRRYETLLLFSPELNSEERQGLLENFSNVITGQGGEVALVDDWGMKQLAYPVKKQTRGSYVRLEYVLPGESVAELERIIRIADGVFRYVTVKLDDNVAVETAEA